MNQLISAFQEVSQVQDGLASPQHEKRGVHAPRPWHLPRSHTAVACVSSTMTAPATCACALAVHVHVCGMACISGTAPAGACMPVDRRAACHRCIYIPPMRTCQWTCVLKALQCRAFAAGGLQVMLLSMEHTNQRHRGAWHLAVGAFLASLERTHWRQLARVHLVARAFQ